MRKRTDGSSIWEARQRYDRQNQEAAALVLADLERYPEGSAMRRWAEMVAAKEEIQK
jgi:hypothetical protein